MRNWWLISNKKGIAQAVPPFVFERIEKCAWIVLRNELQIFVCSFFYEQYTAQLPQYVNQLFIHKYRNGISGFLTSVSPGVIDVKLPNSASPKYFSVNWAANSPDSSSITDPI